MSEDNQAGQSGQPADGSHDAGETKPVTGGDGTDWKAEAEKWKKLSRQNEDRAKANHEELEKLRAAQDSSKTETQKLADRIEAAEKRAAEAEGKALRAEVAQAKGLTAAQAKRLQGASKEELEADADELLDAFGGAKKDDGDEAGKSGRLPKEKLRPGASAPNDDEDPDKLADKVWARSRGI